ncbi:MAG TPA: amino acid adenylation domain-containing protein, partial [Blastocatellia bacterium]|nr:amino acid adenylation domain-containing protein [Blastocatellia bacterium]
TCEWNGAGNGDHSSDRVFSVLFEEAVKQGPDASALVEGDSVLTYLALNERANQLARYLGASGPRGERTVAFCLSRSTTAVIAMLGCLKAGFAYLPLDPNNPQDRLKAIVRDAGVSFVIRELGERAGRETGALTDLADGEAPVLDADALRGLSDYSPDNLHLKPLPETAAYVIYTSGSTGTPKGVTVEQRNLTSYVRAIVDRLNLGAGMSFAALSAPSADLGYTALFPALATGGCFHIVPEEFFLDGEALARYFELRHIDCLKIVPSHLAALQRAAYPHTLMPRTTLVLGGEPSNAGWVRSLVDAFPQVFIVNHYGPTETTVGASTFAIEKTVLGTRSNTPPIGRPLANSRLYLLSEDLDAVPIGAAGGLYIGGHGVARGYSGQTDATAAKFMPDPFSEGAGARMYASEDLGRYLADGAIEFLGRGDDQLKVRGYRVEPKEIEHLLLAHPDVCQAAVVPSKPGTRSSGIELVAYVVPKRPRARTIAGHARYTLPNGMSVVQINKNETDYIYREIFELEAYLRFGTELPERSVILDVGANIGLFTLFVEQIRPSATVLAFEPNPRAFEMLKINSALYAPGARVFNHGLASSERTAEFTAFSGFTLFSGLYADAKTEKQVVKRFIANQADGSGLAVSELADAADELLDQRFESETFPVRLRTIADVMDENGIDRVDLLKINVEKSELEVLQGIDDAHWPHIDQIVLEVDLQGNMPAITGMLRQRGYQVNVMQDRVLAGTELSYVYARRATRGMAMRARAATGTRLESRAPDPYLTSGELEAYLARRLPDYMVPRAILILEALPLAPNGKIDRAALPEPDAIGQPGAEKFVPPGNAMERAIALAWQEVLGVPSVSVN